MLTVLVSPEMVCTIKQKSDGKPSLITTITLPQNFALAINKPTPSTLMKRSILEDFGAQRLLSDKTALPSGTIIICNISTQDAEAYYFYPASTPLNEAIQNFNQLIKNFTPTQCDRYTVSSENKHCFLQKLKTRYSANNEHKNDFTFYSFTIDSMKKITDHDGTSSTFQHDDSLQFQFFDHPSRDNEFTYKKTTASFAPLQEYIPPYQPQNKTQSTMTLYKTATASPTQEKQNQNITNNTHAPSGYDDIQKYRATTYTKPPKDQHTLYSKDSGPEQNGLSCWFGWVEKTEKDHCIKTTESSQNYRFGCITCS
jgi:hypothetical protein